MSPLRTNFWITFSITEIISGSRVFRAAELLNQYFLWGWSAGELLAKSLILPCPRDHKFPWLRMTGKGQAFLCIRRRKLASNDDNPMIMLTLSKPTLAGSSGDPLEWVNHLDRSIFWSQKMEHPFWGRLRFWVEVPQKVFSSLRC